MRTSPLLATAVILLSPNAIADSSCPPDRYEGSFLTLQSVTVGGQETTEPVSLTLRQVEVDANGQIILRTDTTDLSVVLEPTPDVP